MRSFPNYITFVFFPCQFSIFIDRPVAQGSPVHLHNSRLSWHTTPCNRSWFDEYPSTQYFLCPYRRFYRSYIKYTVRRISCQVLYLSKYSIALFRFVVFSFNNPIAVLQLLHKRSLLQFPQRTLFTFLL